MESDSGTFTPLGLIFNGNNTLSQCVVYETLQLLQSINSTQLKINRSGFKATDLSVFVQSGVPSVGLDNKNDKYFYFHHTEGDTMSVLNSEDLDKCTAVWTATAYVFANLNDMLQR